MSMERRIAPAMQAAPELASLNMGSFNFNISPAEKGCRDPQPWEIDYLRGTRDETEADDGGDRDTERAPRGTASHGAVPCRAAPQLPF